jgi:predicted nucleic acid-binding protein
MEAVIDTSFWSIACLVNLDAYIYEFYHTPIHVPPAVDAEIESDRLRGSIVGPDRQRYRLAVQDRRLSSYGGSIQPYCEFGLGEREAIGLAKQLGADLLINDHRPYLAAQAIGISVVSVPEMIVIVHKAELINDNMVSGMLNKIVNCTATPLVDLARNMIIQS